jgi:3-isopropylmalate/(R)-2-methylmalate dehydratase large subunit
MGHTLAENIIAGHVGGKVVGPSLSEGEALRPGQLVEVAVDAVLANDITAPIAIREFARLGVDRVFDPDRVFLVPDHFTPNKDIKSAEQCLAMRQFAREHKLSHYVDVGRVGIEHVLLPEQGWVKPGDIVVGADSHTCTYGALGAFATGMGSTDIAVAMATGRIWLRVPETMRVVYVGDLQPWVSGKDLILYTIGRIGVSGALYKAMQFTGPVIAGLSMAGRFTMANMAIEAGAKVGLFEVDATTRSYLAGRIDAPYQVFEGDEDADIDQEIVIEVSDIEPQVAFPHLPENARPVGEASDIEIDQAVIGSCTNGRIEDLRVAAQLLRGHQVHSDVRCIVIPGTQQVYLDALREGLIEDFVEAGAVVSTPTCGPCLGGHMGVLAAGERAISTTNRNFRGRMGHPDSEVYLASPAVAAASALTGRITSPGEVAQ